MVQIVKGGRYEVERVAGTSDVWWVYDYHQNKGAMVVITEILDPATGRKVALRVVNEDTGRVHTVNANAICDCYAGRRGRYCYHVAAATGRAMEIRRERSAKANISPSGKPLPRRKPAPPACLGPLAGTRA